ncbi:hypothetical protein ACFQ8C_35420 [Streptomyces sp. NPDC056503]|uniref:hypothetical protein n=1 Tax=Streptomyces sp. NPDC056503 TaxID=3345842 RepID=UPI0036B2F273
MHHTQLRMTPLGFPGGRFHHGGTRRRAIHSYDDKVVHRSSIDRFSSKHQWSDALLPSGVAVDVGGERQLSSGPCWSPATCRYWRKLGGAVPVTPARPVRRRAADHSRLDAVRRLVGLILAEDLPLDGSVHEFRFWLRNLSQNRYP